MRLQAAGGTFHAPTSCCGVRRPTGLGSHSSLSTRPHTHTRRPGMVSSKSRRLAWLIQELEEMRSTNASRRDRAIRAWLRPGGIMVMIMEALRWRRSSTEARGSTGWICRVSPYNQMANRSMAASINRCTPGNQSIDAPHIHTQYTHTPSPNAYNLNTRRMDHHRSSEKDERQPAAPKGQSRESAIVASKHACLITLLVLLVGAVIATESPNGI